MTAMRLKLTVGMVLSLTGTVFSLLHIALLVLAYLPRRHHGSEMWAAAGFIVAIAGLLLLGTVKNDRK